MKLTYKIIWVEDKIETKPFESLIGNIKQFLIDKFFDVEIQTAENLEEFKLKFDRYGSFDLVITDFSLNDSLGSQVIDFVRNDKNILTEVFFYSANTQLRDVSLINSSRISFYNLEGTGYHAELQRKIKELIALTVSKFEHIVTMRGMIMHETSTLDMQMESIVRCQIENPKLKDEIEPVLQKILDNILKNAEEKYKKAVGRNLNSILKDNFMFSANQKVFALGEILDLIGEDNFSKSYLDEIISIRNKFAHSELLKDEKGKEYFKLNGENVFYDAEFCKCIRRDIIKHKKKLDELNSRITI